jgi:hypothetical protein
MGRCGSTPAACANAPKKPRAQATNRVLAILVIPFKSFNCAPLQQLQLHCTPGLRPTGVSRHCSRPPAASVSELCCCAPL